jgi:hypothetical protein
MNLIKKHWPLIGFILAMLIDEKTGLIASLFHDNVLQNIIKGLGSIILAYFWNPAFNDNVLKSASAMKADNTDPIRTNVPKGTKF